MDRMLFLKLPKTKLETEGLYSTELLKRELENSSEKVTILAIGPLTNIATLIKTHKTLVDKIQQIVIMGGAVCVPGNIKDFRFFSKNEWAEWNIYCDPHAANIVFSSGIPITLVPLDATNQISVNTAFANSLDTEEPNQASILAAKILRRLSSRVEKETYFLWDVIAGAIMVFTRSLGETGATIVVMGGIRTIPVLIVDWVEANNFISAVFAATVVIMFSAFLIFALRLASKKGGKVIA